MTSTSPKPLKRTREDISEGALSERQHDRSKKQKTKRQWQVPKSSSTGADEGERWQASSSASPSWAIEPGDAGIWATCAMGKEAKCVGELRDMFNDAAEELYGTSQTVGMVAANSSSSAGARHEEVSIEEELEGLRNPAKQEPWFSHVRVDVQCVIFFRCNSPTVDPTAVVRRICHAALASTASGAMARKTRFIKRLTPQTRMCKASESALLQIAAEVLEPHFPLPSSPSSPSPQRSDVPMADPANGGGQSRSANGGGEDDDQTGETRELAKEISRKSKTFAIRPTLRNHSRQLSRESIIRSVANFIAQRNFFPASPSSQDGADVKTKEHDNESGKDGGTSNVNVNVHGRTRRYRVNLNDPDVLILVEVYRSIAGIVALNAREWERCKRFNLSEIFSPTVATGSNAAGTVAATATATATAGDQPSRVAATTARTW